MLSRTTGILTPNRWASSRSVGSISNACQRPPTISSTNVWLTCSLNRWRPTWWAILRVLVSRASHQVTKYALWNCATV